MNCHKFLRLMAGATLFASFLAGCGAPQVIVITATPQDTPEPVVIVVTPTFTPIINHTPSPKPIDTSTAPTEMHEPTGMLDSTVTVINYPGKLWAIKKASLEQECMPLPAGFPLPTVGEGEMCLMILFHNESSSSTPLITAVMTELPYVSIAPLFDDLDGIQVVDNLGNRYSPFIHFLSGTGTKPSDFEPLDHICYFYVSTDAIQFYLVGPEKEKILLDLVSW